MKSLSGLRVCHVTTSHPAHDDRIFFKEARSLARVGADVTLLCSDTTAFPATTDGVNFRHYAGGGSIKRRVSTTKSLEAALEQGDYAIIHCHEPDGLWAALRVKKRRPVKVIFDSHEMWSASLAQRFAKPFWGPISLGYRAVERPMVRQADAAIGASWAITDYLGTILGRNNVVTILNAPVVEIFRMHGERQWNDETIFCHDGTLGFDRGLKTMAEAIRIVKQKHPVTLKIVGDVFGQERAWLDAFVSRHALGDTIVRTGWLPYTEVGEALSSCHVGLIALKKLPNNIVTSSNKVFNYMLYGMPFIGPSFRLAKQKLVDEEKCGLLADSEDPASYAAAMLVMVENREQTQEMSRRALHASMTKYRWEHMEPVLFELYEHVLHQR